MACALVSAAMAPVFRLLRSSNSRASICAMLRPLPTCAAVITANCAVVSALRLSDGRLDSWALVSAETCAVKSCDS